MRAKPWRPQPGPHEFCSQKPWSSKATMAKAWPPVMLGDWVMTPSAPTSFQPVCTVQVTYRMPTSASAVCIATMSLWFTRK